MATDFQSPMASSAQPSPAPSSTRAHSKSRSRSRPARRRRDSSPAPPSSPPGLPTPAFSPDGHSDLDDEIGEEDTLSPFDARRITPTLHASLVSEILNLRREIEHKTRAIDVLEQSLDESRTETETLGENLSRATREARSLKHQIQLLEGGTSSAMTELARERDEAVESINDVRKKLEQTQKRARSREEEAERTQMLWDRDRDTWENERRNLERKVHVVEGRLKTVLNEFAAAQEAGTLVSQHGENEDTEKDKTKGSDTASVASSSQGRRRTSMTSVTTDEGDNDAPYHNVRYSVMSLAPGKGDSGLNLAQELAFDKEEEDEFVAFDDDETPASPEALPEERPLSVHSAASHDISSKARKILGLSMQSNASAIAAEFRAVDTPNPVKVDSRVAEYRDTGIQYSPPPSPESLAAVVEVEPVPADIPMLNITAEEESSEMKDSSTLTIEVKMVSSSCQTIGELPSPPWTPKVPESPVRPAVEATPEPVRMATASTQTDPLPEAEPLAADKATLSPNDVPSQMDVPMIAIHPPASEPPSPRNSVVLPPQTKNVSVQANFRSVVDGRSIAIQTEEIRIDQRPVKLPASLLPSAIPDLPIRSEVKEPVYQPYRPPVPPPRSAKREQRPFAAERPVKPPRAQPSELVQAYPGNNDNGPLSDDLVSSGLRRPFRSSSLFAGFEQLSDDEDPAAEERDIFTDDELLNRPFASYTLRRGKMVNAKSRPSLDEMTLPEIDEHLSDPESGPYDVARGSRPVLRSGASTTSSIRQPGMRKMAMISSGAAAHQKTRARSPSEPSLDSGSAGSSIAPPFPVPIRLSSRKRGLNGSDGPPSPTRSARQFSDRGARTTVVRRPTLRRVRSAAAMSNSDLPERPETRSSPARSASSFVLDSPSYNPPPMPFDDITAPRDRRNVQKRASHRATESTGWNHDRQDSTGGVQPTSVVDAIAQTMVGEWMFKYVRRRKSFGMGESKDNWEGKNPDEVSANITNSGVRHKRWVWLAPYEGAIMWSSKQPTSGPALLGKSGRKFTIQSVLDVKDDNPMPKGSITPAPFNRSILVLTPQRALKFTALTVERHYVWLTALSFLSHSSMGLQDLAAIPPAPQEEAASPPPLATLRRNPIRDSIRVAKGKPRPMPKGKRSFPSAPVPELPSVGDLDNMAADAPHVPRFSNHSSHHHTRKRSNTAPRPPALHAIRSFSSQGTMPSSHSGTTGSNEPYFSPVAPPALPQGIRSGRSSISRTSEGSGRTANTATSNMFDVGTVRMEAFIDHHAEQINRPRAVPSVKQRHARKTSSQWSAYDGRSVDESELSFRSDPFRGF
ncbi:putative nuclear migration protein [Penicillium brasilianum]|uniref:Putative nuclear migration protein n=1 Tax=Penicillium brasilianum TaxID=104259 RepID=A0A1S9RTK7_PENBI|nr:putative nuclear migration protein [Penicillium brasilianum]